MFNILVSAIKASTVLGITALLLIAYPAKSHDGHIVRFCVPNADVYPFFLNVESDISGINPDLISSAFQHEALRDIKLEYVKRPWKRCNLALQSGEIDMIIGSFEAQRDSVGVYPNELGFPLEDMVVSTAEVCFVSINGPQMDKTRQGMAGEIPFTVGVEAGFSQEHDPKINPEWLVMFNHLEKYRLLQKGRVDAIVEVCSMDNTTITTKSQSFGFTDFVTLEPPYLSNPAYVVYSEIFAKEHESLAKLILQEIQKVNKKEIYERYRQSD